MMTTADVFRGLKDRWDHMASEWTVDGTLAELVPGGLHQGRVPQTSPTGDQKKPYASVKVTEQDPQYNSGSAYVQVFTVELTVWADRDGSLDDPGSIQRAIDQAFHRDDASEIEVPNATRTMDLVRQAGRFDEDGQTRQGNDVLVVGYRWDLWLQGDRS